MRDKWLDRLFTGTDQHRQLAPLPEIVGGHGRLTVEQHCSAARPARNSIHLADGSVEGTLQQGPCNHTNRPPLKAALDAALKEKRLPVTILVNSFGRQWTRTVLGQLGQGVQEDVAEGPALQ